MGKTAHKKKRIRQNKSSSSESSSSGSESSDSQSPSSGSISGHKTSKTMKSKETKNKGEKSSSPAREIKVDKKKQKGKVTEDDRRLIQQKRVIIEQSKWDSPNEKHDNRPRITEKIRKSSVEMHDDKKIRGKEKDPEHGHKHRSKHENKDLEERDRSRNNVNERRRQDSRTSRDHDRNEQNKRDQRERYDRHSYRDRSHNRNKDQKNDNDEEQRETERNRSTDRYRGNHRDRPRRNDNYYRNKRRRSRSNSFNHAEAKWGKKENTDIPKSGNAKEKEKPNFTLSGKLTEETNTYKGIVIKYSEPPEARKPKRRWRLYPFKGEKAMQTLYIHRESAYLIGRDRKVVDLPVDHPSCSKQHAVLQYRLVSFTRDDETVGKRVRPYLIDLESANGTFINNKKIESKKYVELLERDVIKFGYSSREYVLLHENSKDEAQDDDVKMEEEELVEVKREVE